MPYVVTYIRICWTLQASYSKALIPVLAFVFFDRHRRNAYEKVLRRHLSLWSLDCGIEFLRRRLCNACQTLSSTEPSLGGGGKRGGIDRIHTYPDVHVWYTEFRALSLSHCRRRHELLIDLSIHKTVAEYADLGRFDASFSVASRCLPALPPTIGRRQWRLTDYYVPGILPHWSSTAIGAFRRGVWTESVCTSLLALVKGQVRNLGLFRESGQNGNEGRCQCSGDMTTMLLLQWPAAKKREKELSTNVWVIYEEVEDNESTKNGWWGWAHQKQQTPRQCVQYDQ